MTPIARRGVLAAPAALGLASAAGRPAAAAAPPVGRQVAGLYRTRVGDIEVTCVADGTIALPAALFGEANQADARRVLAENFIDAATPVPCAVNTFLVNSGGRLALIDAGSGAWLGPTMGQLAPNLAAMGVTPAEIDVVILTHLHRDHAGGLLDRENRPLFPRAEIVVPEAEAAFWMDEGNSGRVPQGSRGGFPYAAQVAAAYRDRLRRVPGGREVAPGVTSIDAFGHTPGHTIYRIASGNAQLLVFGDMVHVPVLQSRFPGWGIAFDVDAATAAATRRRVFDMAVADRLLVAGMHLDFPGLARMRRAGEGFEFVAAPWQAVL
ncbi:MBL fold metallo-hydrolase [Roseomonas sp. PWR1]|uniref:MBL fold metallo-hydrolase n=1 Tax=Roseomonas nitratireducens TaxID=2820810 RepID=A0ABS4AVY7_9PROT|nr:MBL fold metallo-hydrolase [Neoroseomonas nitratireducens]MBP0465527.1 MBL fold metallo-hydrolase [Neoroseomonas nitratireducens]